MTKDCFNFVTLRKIRDLSRKFIIRSIAVGMLYIAVASYILKNEETFFFNYHPLEAEASYSFEEPFLELNIQVNEDIELHGIWFTQKEPRGVLLFFPPGDFNMETYQVSQNYFYKKGFAVVIPDYRGTGKSTNTYYREEDLYQDTEQWYKLAKSLSDSSLLVVSGQDFGSGMAAYISAQHAVDLTLLQNPYYSWNEVMLKNYFWWLPHSMFTKYKIPLWEFVRKSENKIILLYTESDDFIKINNSERLLQYLKPGDDFIILNEGETAAQSMNFQKYMEKIRLY